MEHLSRSDFMEFFTKPNRLLHGRAVGHLLDGCAPCLTEARDALDAVGVLVPPPFEQDLALVLQESALLKDERAKAAVSWARLADLDENERLKAFRGRRGLCKWGLASYVLDEAESFVARGRGSKAAELVRFSEVVRESLPVKIYGAAPLAELQLRQEATLCLAKLKELDFVGALAALGRGERIKDAGVGLREKARFFRIQALLLFDLGDLEAAARAARESATLYNSIHDEQSTGKALLQEASIARLFDPSSALELAERGLKLLTGPEPKALLSGLFTKCDCLIKLNRANEADQLLASRREQVRLLADTSDELWFRYIDALLWKSRGKARDADAILCHLALRFREEGLYHEMIFQHLERIRLKAETGRWKSALNIAARLTPELARLGLRNDLLGMWASLQDSLIQRRDVVSEIEDLFRRRWNAPGRPAGR